MAIVPNPPGACTQGWREQSLVFGRREQLVKNAHLFVAQTRQVLKGFTWPWEIVPEVVALDVEGPT